MSTTAWIVVVVVVLTVAPLAVVLLLAVLRGYTVDMHLGRRRKSEESDS